LIKAGAFDSFGQPRRELLMVHEDAVDAVTNLKRKLEHGQYDLFGGIGEGEPSADASPLAHLKIGEEEWPRKQRVHLAVIRRARPREPPRRRKETQGMTATRIEGIP
jgi:DNA polymerase III subunit alpha